MFDFDQVEKLLYFTTEIILQLRLLLLDLLFILLQYLEIGLFTN